MADKKIKKKDSSLTLDLEKTKRHTGLLRSD